MNNTIRLGLVCALSAMAWGCGSDGAVPDSTGGDAAGSDGGAGDAEAGDSGASDGSVLDSGLTCIAPMANCSGKASDGCNVDLSKDNQNCGGCGVVCNTQCNAGVCPLFTADAGAPQLVGDFACLTVDATSVYWGTGLPSGGGGGVWKVPVNGGSPSLLIGAQDRPHGMASDGTNLYYANAGSGATIGSIQRIPVGGGVPTPIAIAQALPLDLAVDATNVYWTNSGDGTVWKSNKTTPAPIKIADGGGSGHAEDLRIDATYAYFTDPQGGSVLRVPLDGSAPAPQTLTTAPRPRPIAIDSKTAYFGASTGVLAIALNANNGIAGQVLPNVVIQGIETDGANVWYTIPSQNGQPKSGTINRATTTGQGVTLLAKGQNRPGCISVDAKSVYWINEGDGQISKTGK